MRRLTFGMCAVAVVGLSVLAEPSVNDRLLALAPEPGFLLVEEVSLAPQATRGVVVVSEPHINIAGQQALFFVLRDMLAATAEAKVLFCVEGAAGDFDLATHRQRYAENPQPYQAAVAAGLLSGWELCALADARVTVTGVETPEQYREQVDTFDDSYTDYRRHAQAMGTSIRDNLIAILGKLEAATPERYEAAGTAIMGLVGACLDQEAYVPDATMDRYAKTLNAISPETKPANDALVTVLRQRNAFLRAKIASDFAPLRTFAAGNAGFLKSIETQEAVNRVAARRDETMVARTLAAMAAQNVDLAVLFIGSFHRPGVCQGLRDASVSWVYAERQEYAKDPNTDEDALYLRRLRGEALTARQTMPPSYLHPVLYPESAQQFVQYLDAMSPEEVERLSAWCRPADEVTGGRTVAAALARTLEQFYALLRQIQELPAGEEDAVMAMILQLVQRDKPIDKKEFQDVLDELKATGVKIDGPLAGGASGDPVFGVTMPDGRKCIGKLVFDADKGRRDVHNVTALNRRAEAEGRGRLYARYLATREVKYGPKTALLTLQERLPGESLRKQLSDELFKMGDQWTARRQERAEYIRDLTARMLAENPDALHYANQDTAPRELLAKLRRKIAESKTLNKDLYREAENTRRLEELYAQLDTTVGDLLDHPGEFANLEVVRDTHAGNYFPVGRDGCFIDSVDDTIGPVCKQLALTLKDRCVANLDTAHLTLDNAANDKVVRDAFAAVLGTDVSADQMVGVIGFLEVFRRSDSQAALGSAKGWFPADSTLNDAQRNNLLVDTVPELKDRKIKNYLILKLLEIYNERYQKGIEKRLKFFQDCYRDGLYVRCNHWQGHAA